MPLPRLFRIGLPALAAGCAGHATDDSGANAHFCFQMSDADTWYVQSGGATAPSGALFGQLVSSVTTDIHSPNMVANWDYLLENLDVQGIQTRGTTEQSGEFYETLGAGNWSIQISGQRNAFTCANEVQFEIEAGNTTELCFDAGCH